MSYKWFLPSKIRIFKEIEGKVVKVETYDLSLYDIELKESSNEDEMILLEENERMLILKRKYNDKCYRENELEIYPKIIEIPLKNIGYLSNFDIVLRND